MSSQQQDFSAALNLTQAETDTFVGAPMLTPTRALYGGQLLCQAVIAAEKTAPEYALQSLHGYFLRPGDRAQPVSYRVERLRDGRSFANRQVCAEQNGKLIFQSLVMLQKDEYWLESNSQMPDVVSPDDLPTIQTLWRGWLADESGEPGLSRLASLLGVPKITPEIAAFFTHPWPMEVRPIDPVNPLQLRSVDELQDEPNPASSRSRMFWFRLVDAELEREWSRLWRSVLAFVSDYALLGTTLAAEDVCYLDSRIRSASLDHAIWFHRTPQSPSQWMLYAMHSNNLYQSRGLSRGEIYDQQGRLLASTTQEGLVRLKAPSVRR